MAGFDNEKYIEKQSAAILRRMAECDGKLYLECGGKLLFDMHASRVLPGYDPNVKMKVFHSFRDRLEVVLCVGAPDIERGKIQSDFGISYGTDVFKMIDDFARWDIKVRKVVVTRFSDEPSVLNFKERLQRLGAEVYLHRSIPGYPNDTARVVSAEGYGANPYIPTTKPVVVVTGPGPGSGKLATCLGQMYHDYRAGRRSGYSKFETFPIWNLPLNHPVNIAYEAATADIGDYAVIDHFYLESTGSVAVNYNRDMDAFPILSRILARITDSPLRYDNPTQMSVNRLADAIIDDEVVRRASRQEIIRRCCRASCDYASGIGTEAALARCRDLMAKAGLVLEDRPTVGAMREALKDAVERGKSNKGVSCSAALQLRDGTIVTSHNSPILHAASAMVLNALKFLAGVPEGSNLIPPSVILAVTGLKRDRLAGRGVSLNLDETLICLAMASTLDKETERALQRLPELRGCEAHLSHIPSPGDISGLRKVGINFTSEPRFTTTNFLSL